MLIIYNLLRFLLYIIMSVAFVFNAKIREFLKRRLLSDFNSDVNIEKSNDRKTDNFILVHLSSVGEFNLSKELINRLLNKSENIIISVMTDTGYEAIKKTYKNNDKVKIIYFPLDDYFLLKKLYKNYTISKTIIIETEIWPNLYNFASKYGELYIVNGRLTDKRLRSYLKFKGFIKSILEKSRKIMVQSAQDLERYKKLGVNEKKLKEYKNLKYSIEYEKMTEERKDYYKKNIINLEKKIIVCGSTRPGEEKIWLNVFKEITRFSNDYQLVIVPRHLDRIKEIENEIEKLYESKENKESKENTDDKKNKEKFWTTLSEKEKNLEEKKSEEKNLKEKKSEAEKLEDKKLEEKKSGNSEKEKCDILIVDKMGVLRDFYQLADFVFVGGTLVDIGGHSILEPLYYGKKPIIGKYYQNIEDIVVEAEKLNFIKIIKSDVPEKEIIEYMKKSEIVDTKEFFIKNNEIEKIVEELYN